VQWDRGEAGALARASAGKRRRWVGSSTRRDVAGSIAVSLLTQLALLLSGVAGARILGVLDRGRSALLLLFATVLPLLGTLGMPLSVTYWIARDVQLARRLVTRLRRLVVIQTTGLLIVHAGVLLVVFAGAPAHVQVAAALSLLATPSIVLFLYALGVLQGTRDFRALNLSRLIFPPLNAAVLTAVLLSGGGGLWLVTFSWVALYGVSAVVAAMAARRSLQRLPADGDSQEPLPGTREMVTFGCKALLGSMSPLTGFQLDQAIVGLFISQAALGIYVVAVAFTNLPRFVAQSIGLVAYPHVAAGGDGRGAARAIVRFTALTLVLCGLIVGATELALPLLVAPLFGHAFAAAVGVGRILLVGSLLFCLTRTLSDCARGAGRPGLGTVAEIVSLVTMFPFVALLAGSGVTGVATAVVLAAGSGVASILIGLMIPAKRRGHARSQPPVTDRPVTSAGKRSAAVKA
jgi:O-antigen/teichoic acid export membrane protein